MMSKRDLVPLPGFWRKIFFWEIPLVMVSVACWWFWPHVFLGGFGVVNPSSAEIFSLNLYAGVVLTMVGLFYAFLLAQEVVYMPYFWAYQFGLLLGDIYIVTFTIYYYALYHQSASLLIQIGMALTWGLVRLKFLVDMYK